MPHNGGGFLQGEAGSYRLLGHLPKHLGCSSLTWLALQGKQTNSGSWQLGSWQQPGPLPSEVVRFCDLLGELVRITGRSRALAILFSCPC